MRACAYRPGIYRHVVLPGSSPAHALHAKHESLDDDAPTHRRGAAITLPDAVSTIQRISSRFKWCFGWCNKCQTFLILTMKRSSVSKLLKIWSYILIFTMSLYIVVYLNILGSMIAWHQRCLNRYFKNKHLIKHIQKKHVVLKTICLC